MLWETLNIKRSIQKTTKTDTLRKKEMEYYNTVIKSIVKSAGLMSGLFLVGCFDGDNIRLPPPDPVEIPDTPEPTSSEVLLTAIESAAPGAGKSAFMLPASDDFAAIPQDPNNPITEEKVVLGQMLFHETAISTEGVNGNLNGSWSCASCHHVAAGFKSGVPQGIAEGGSGFGINGEGRILLTGFDKDSEDPTLVPDVQPVTSPTILNTAYQEVMLWNGQFGNMQGGQVNANLEQPILATPDTPKAENLRGLAGLEIQAIAGTKVHRLNTFENSVLQTNPEYMAMFDAAFPDGTEDYKEDAGKAIAAYERTVLANESPFQKWLAGDESAMTEDEIKGATLFFDKGNCVSCHTGPGLSSQVDASAEELFMAIGFGDFDTSNPQVTGSVSDADSRGRGGFTGNAQDDFKFKVPQLYNLADSNVFGHGATFESIRAIIEYKNNAVPQKDIPSEQLDSRFAPLNLTEEEISYLTQFLETGLYDNNLQRYVPDALPTGLCFPVADEQAKLDLNC